MIDECHNFLNLPYRIDDMLAEARGFRLSLTLAHQHLAQLPPGAARGHRHQRPQQDLLHRRRPTTPATWPATPNPTSTTTTWPTSTPSTPPPACVDHGAHTPAFTLRTQPLPHHARAGPSAARAAARNTRTAAPPVRTDRTRQAPRRTTTTATSQRPRVGHARRPPRADPRRRPT